MNILILGASGKTGREVVAQAVATGHTVTAFVRDPAKLERDDVAVAVDARSVDDLRTALRGQDSVISTLGTNRGDDNKLIESSTQACWRQCELQASSASLCSRPSPRVRPLRGGDS